MGQVINEQVRMTKEVRRLMAVRSRQDLALGIGTSLGIASVTFSHTDVLEEESEAGRDGRGARRGLLLLRVRGLGVDGFRRALSWLYWLMRSDLRDDVLV